MTPDHPNWPYTATTPRANAGEYVLSAVQQPTPTMTPETREELARAIRTHFANDMTMQPVLNAIAPIIERLVAERVAAETERCAKVAESFEPKSYIKDWRDGYETARNYIAFAIRSTTR